MKKKELTVEEAIKKMFGKTDKKRVKSDKKVGKKKEAD